MKKLITLVLIIMLQPTFALTIIVNKGNETTQMTKMELKKIFLAKKQVWDSGEAILLVVNEENNNLLQAFAELIGLDKDKFKFGWIRITLSGQAPPPQPADSDADVNAYVEKNIGAIGFVETPTDAVKALSID